MKQQDRKIDVQKSVSAVKRVSPMMILGIFAIIAGSILLSWNYLRPKPAEPLGVVHQDVLVNVPPDQVPEDSLYITRDRRDYKGDMHLVIPALEIRTLVGTDTDAEGLKISPGLYEFSQMPSESGGNVSIAGHRDIFGKEFYYLHNLQEGDLLYLVYEDSVYKYLYLDSEVVSADDWSVIKRQGFTCLTLTTCDPIGTSLNRLIITSQLLDVSPYTDQFRFEIRTNKISR